MRLSNRRRTVPSFMTDPYQRGSDEEWLQHSNAELADLIKKRNLRIRSLKLAVIILFFALAWTVFKFTQNNPIAELWSL